VQIIFRNYTAFSISFWSQTASLLPPQLSQKQSICRLEVLNIAQKHMLKNCITFLLAKAGGHAKKLSGFLPLRGVMGVEASKNDINRSRPLHKYSPTAWTN
jgi:hypothetical protein